MQTQIVNIEIAKFTFMLTRYIIINTRKTLIYYLAKNKEICKNKYLGILVSFQ